MGLQSLILAIIPLGNILSERYIRRRDSAAGFEEGVVRLYGTHSRAHEHADHPRRIEELPGARELLRGGRDLLDALRRELDVRDSGGATDFGPLRLS